LVKQGTITTAVEFYACQHISNGPIIYDDMKLKIINRGIILWYIRDW